MKERKKKSWQIKIFLCNRKILSKDKRAKQNYTIMEIETNRLAWIKEKAAWSLSRQCALMVQIEFNRELPNTPTHLLLCSPLALLSLRFGAFHGSWGIPTKGTDITKENLIALRIRCWLGNLLHATPNTIHFRIAIGFVFSSCFVLIVWVCVYKLM